MHLMFVFRFPCMSRYCMSFACLCVCIQWNKKNKKNKPQLYSRSRTALIFVFLSSPHSCCVDPIIYYNILPVIVWLNRCTREFFLGVSLVFSMFSGRKTLVVRSWKMPCRWPSDGLLKDRAPRELNYHSVGDEW